MNPEELLAQIVPLIQEYMAAGGDPNMLMEAVSGGGAGGGMPPEDPMTAGMPPMGGEMSMDPMMMTGDTPVPDMTGAPGYSGGSFKEASAALEEDMKKKRIKA